MLLTQLTLEHVTLEIAYPGTFCSRHCLPWGIFLSTLLVLGQFLLRLLILGHIALEKFTLEILLPRLLTLGQFALETAYPGTY